MTGLQAGGSGIVIRFPAIALHISVVQSGQIASGSHPASSSTRTGDSYSGRKASGVGG